MRHHARRPRSAGRRRTAAVLPTLLALLVASATAMGSPTPRSAGAEPAPSPAGPAAPPASGAAAGAGAPNILFVILDDLREEGVMEVPEVLPATKRWLQAGGTTFTEGLVTTSLCCPERATIWSGRVPHNHGVFDNYTGDSLDRDWIVPRYLRDAGYRTALVGKFITDWKFRYEPPHFDEWAVFQGGYDDARFWVKDPAAPRPRTERAPYSTDYIAEKAIEYIAGYEASDARPWFMHVSPHAPHNITEATKRDCELEELYTWPDRHDGAPLPPWRPTPPVVVEGNDSEEKADKVHYLRHRTFPADCAEVTHTGHMATLLAADEMVDRIMTALEAHGELDRTLVVFTSDNGFAWGERGMTSKALPYTEHVKVPVLVRWDGVFPAGGVDARPVSGEDFLATYLHAAGSTPPAAPHPLDGRSFLPGEPGRAEKYLEFGPVGRPSPSAYKGHRSIPTWASLRSPEWQYIEYYEDDNTTVQFREYYDLRTDPWQLDNLLADADPGNDPDVAALADRLRRAATCSGTTGANPCP